MARFTEIKETKKAKRKAKKRPLEGHHHGRRLIKVQVLPVGSALAKPNLVYRMELPLTKLRDSSCEVCKVTLFVLQRVEKSATLFSPSCCLSAGDIKTTFRALPKRPSLSEKICCSI